MYSTGPRSHEFVLGSPGHEQQCGYPHCGRGPGALVHGPVSESGARIQNAAVRADLQRQRDGFEELDAKYPGLRDIPELARLYGLTLSMQAKVDGEPPPAYRVAGGWLQKRPAVWEQYELPDLPAAS